MKVMTQPAYFERLSPAQTEPDRRTSQFVSTQHAQGTWQEDELHMAVVSGLVTAELEAYAFKDGFEIGRISFEILGKLHAGELTLTTETLRPGRTIELVETTVTMKGRAALRARCWRLIKTDSSAVAVNNEPEILPLDQCHDADALSQWPGGYIATLSTKVAPEHRPGSGMAWITTQTPMIAGETSSDLVRLIGMVDTANGVAPVMHPAKDGFAFPNVDLGIHLLRRPEGQWLGLNTTASAGDSGFGLTSAVLYDEHGPFGRSEQLQTIRPIS